MKLFLDTNTVIDYLAAREPFCNDIRPIFLNRAKYNLILQTASMTFTTMEYIFKKKVDHSLLMDKFAALRCFLEVIPSDSQVIDRAIASKFQDFEDAVQHYTAIAGKADFILTRNLKDFKSFSEIPVLSPKDFTDRYFDRQHK